MNKPLITKEQFVKVMNFMKDRDESFEQLSDAMENLAEGFHVDFFPNYDYNAQIVFLLSLLLNEPTEDTLIDYFIYELEWGKSNHASTAFTFNNHQYDLSSIEKLYDALIDINFTRANETVHSNKQQKDK